MAKGQDLSRHQQGIVKRYYEHRGTIMSNKLQELVSDLALCEDAKKREALWGRVEKALANLKVDAKTADAVLKSRSVERLAELVARLGA